MIALTHQAIPDETVKQLFEEAFPYEERREWPAILDLLAAGKVKFLCLTRGADFAGFVFYWPLPAFTFVEYLAIHPSSRGEEPARISCSNWKSSSERWCWKWNLL